MKKQIIRFKKSPKKLAKEARWLSALNIGQIPTTKIIPDKKKYNRKIKHKSAKFQDS